LPFSIIDSKTTSRGMLACCAAGAMRSSFLVIVLL
jgi:hypothetical protein